MGLLIFFINFYFYHLFSIKTIIKYIYIIDITISNTVLFN